VIKCWSFRPVPLDVPIFYFLMAVRAFFVWGHHQDRLGHSFTILHDHLFDATLGEFYRRAGDLARAQQHLEAARQKTTSPSIAQSSTGACRCAGRKRGPRHDHLVDGMIGEFLPPRRPPCPLITAPIGASSSVALASAA